MKTFLFSILFFSCLLTFGQHSSSIKIIENAQKIDFLGRFWGITYNKYIDIELKDDQLFYKTDLKNCCEWNTEVIPFEDNAIKIEGEWCHLAVCLTDKGIQKRGQFGLVCHNKFYEEGRRVLEYPQVSFYKLRKDEIEQFAPKELKIMRNELYAKYGYKFKKGGEMDRYFSGEEWYQPRVSHIELNEIEKYNTELIRQIEKEKRKTSRVLSKKEMDSIFSESVRNQFNIDVPIRRAYKLFDAKGIFYLVLCEDNTVRYNLSTNDNSVIKAFFLKEKNNKFVLQWKIRDFRSNDKDFPEKSIWFFTRYFDLKDIDNDGIIDPILIYGTSNDYDNDRLKILIYYNNKKVGIRHQNCDLDDCRTTNVDKSFYKLPISIQKYVNKVMLEIEYNNHSTFDKLPLGRH